MNHAAKLEVIEGAIEPAIASITRSVWLKSELMALDFACLKRLTNEIRDCTPKEKLDLIVSWLADNENDQ